MALFKIHKGTGTFPTAATEGYCYFNSETGRFAIDIATATTATTTQRKLINPDAFVAVSRSGATWTFTTADGNTKAITQQDTDTKVKSTATNPSTITSWYLLATTSSATSTGEAVKNANVKVEVLEGTATAPGKAQLVLGNSTASGTAGNKKGAIALFSENTSYHFIQGASTSSAITHTLPATSGTILNSGTTTWTAMDTATAKIGTLKLNGSNKILYDVFLYASTENPIVANTDLNTIKTPGIWYSPDSTRSATLVNAPWASSGFRLTTIGGYGGASSYGYQIAAASSALFWRYMGASNGSPSSWYMIPQISYTGSGVGSSSVPVYMNSSGQILQCSSTLGVSITGTAAKATADADGNTIKSTYLKLSGGTLTGSLNIGANNLAGWKTFSLYRKSDSDASYSTFYYGISSSLNAVQFSLKKYDTSGTQTSEETVYFQTDSIYPGVDCGCNMGLSSRRWNAVYTRTVMLSNTHYTTFCLDATTANSAGTFTRCIVEGSYIDSIGLWVNSDKTNDAHSRRALVIDGYGYQSDVNKAIRVRQCDTSGTWQSDLYVVHSGNYTSYQVDKKVLQSRSTSSSWRPLLSHYIYADYGTDPGSATNAVYYNESIAVQYSTGSLKATSVYGAVWNDYAEYRSGTTTEPGKVVKECPDGILRITESRLEPGCEIISDTFGFAIGETDKCKTPVAASGRVLAYPFEDRDTFELGQAVCSGPNGTVSRMTREEIMMYPERIIGTVSEIPQYETWGTGNIQINGRIWIRIR